LKRYEKIKQRVRKRHASGCHPKLGGAQTKLGLTPINKRNVKIWWLVSHTAAEELSLIADKTFEQERHHVERDEGDFERRFPL